MMSALTEFDRDEDERLIRDSVRRVMQDARRPVVIGGEVTPPGRHAAHYLKELDALGLAELVLAGGALDVPTVRRIASVCEEAGAHLFVTPVAESLALPVLGALGLRLPQDVPAGLVVPAFGPVFAAASPGLRAERSNGGLRIEGEVRRIPHGAMAAGWLVHGGEGEGAWLAVIGAGSAGARVQTEPMADGSQRATLQLEGCQVPQSHVLASGAAAQAAYGQLVDVLMLGTAAQLTGIAARVFQLACEHIRTRHAFGRPLAGFQALQHRAANDYVAVEVTRAYLYQLCDFWEEAGMRRPLLHGLLAKAGQSAIDTAKSAIQMHGAMGFTLEHELGWNLKAAVALASRYGDMSVHRRAFASHDLAFW